MNRVLDKNIQNQSEKMSLEEVRNILNLDNSEIKRLCREISVVPKKDNSTGKAFFLKNDVITLKKLKELHQKSQAIAPENKNTKNTSIAVQTVSQVEVENILNTLLDTKEAIVDKLSKVIDEKLDGMDEVVVELIKSKTETEKLKEKLNSLTKENYSLKTELQSFHSLGFGLYKKNRSVKF